MREGSVQQGDMIISVRPITVVDFMRDILKETYGLERSTMSLALAYTREHTTIRLMLFKVFLENIKSKVSVHLVRHSQTGQFHLVKSNRGDWNNQDPRSIEEWDEQVNRKSPVNHTMVLNANHLLDMSKKRLCMQAEADTRVVMNLIKKAVYLVDPDLANHMVPQCLYRNGLCPEKRKPCAHLQGELLKYQKIIEKTGGSFYHV